MEEQQENIQNQVNFFFPSIKDSKKSFIPEISITEENHYQQRKPEQSQFFQQYKQFFKTYLDEETIRDIHSKCQHCKKRKKIINIPIRQWPRILVEHNYFNLQQNGIFIEQNFQKQTKIQIIQSSLNARIVKIAVKFSYFKFIFSVINFNESFRSYSKQFYQLGFGSYGLIYGLKDDQGSKNVAFKVVNILESQLIIEEKRFYNVESQLFEYCCYRLLSVMGFGLEIPQQLLGFDLLCFEDSILFPMEKAKSLYRLNSKEIPQKQPNFTENLKQSLFFLHSFHITHMDIKPQNVLYSKSLQKFCLIDFGVSEFITAPMGYKSKTYFAGTYEFCSQQMRKLFYSHTSDEIDLYWNDCYSLQLVIKQIELKLSFLERKTKIITFQEQNSQRVQTQSNQIFSLIQNEIMEDQNSSSDFYIKQKIYSNEVKKDKLNFCSMVRLVFQLYKEDYQRVKEILNSTTFNAQALTMIGQFLTDIQPTIKLLKIFTQLLSLKLKPYKAANFHIKQLFNIYINFTTLSAVNFIYERQVQQQNLMRYQINQDDEVLTVKKRFLKKYKRLVKFLQGNKQKQAHQIIEQKNKAIENSFVEYINFLDLLQSLNFYEQHSNHIKNQQLKSFLSIFAKRHFLKDTQNLTVSDILVQILQNIRCKTLQFLEIYCNTGIDDIEMSHLQKIQNKLEELLNLRFLNKQDHENKRYCRFVKNFQTNQELKKFFKCENFQEVNLKQQKQTFIQIFSQGFITNGLPEILYRIAKIYERLQLFQTYIRRLKQSMLYTSSRIRIIEVFYEFIKYSCMNLNKNYEIKVILNDFNFFFTLYNDNLVDEMISNQINLGKKKQFQLNRKILEERQMYGGKNLQKNKNQNKKQEYYNLIAFELNYNEAFRQVNMLKTEKQSKQLDQFDNRRNLNILKRIDFVKKAELKLLLPNDQPENAKNKQDSFSRTQNIREKLEDFVKNKALSQEKSLSSNDQVSSKSQKVSQNSQQTLLNLFTKLKQTQFSDKNQVHLIEIIIREILIKANKISIIESNYFKLVLNVLKDTFLQVKQNNLQRSRKQLKSTDKSNVQENQEPRYHQISNSINYYIKFINSSECLIEKSLKQTLQIDLSILLFDCVNFGVVQDLLKVCENFLAHEFGTPNIDLKRQTFYLLISSKYMSTFPQLSSQLTKNIARQNIFQMKSKFSYQVLTQQAMQKINRISMFKEGQKIICRLLNYFIKKLCPFLVKQKNLFLGNDLFTNFVFTDPELQFPEDINPQGIQVALNTIFLKKIQFFYMQLDSFPLVRFYYDLITFSVEEINKKMGKIFDRKKQLLMLNQIEECYLNKLTRKLAESTIRVQEKINKKQNIQKDEKQETSLKISQQIQVHIQSKLHEIQTLFTGQSLQLYPSYYWQVKSQLVKYSKNKCYQVLYYDQFLMNQKYQQSVSKKVLDKMRNQASQVSIEQKWRKNHMNFYSTYFPPNVYEKWLRFLRQCNQQNQHFQIKSIEKDQSSQKSIDKQIFESLNLHSQDSYIRHLCFYEYIEKNCLQSAFLMPETLQSQNTLIQLFLKFQNYQMICSHFYEISIRCYSFKPFKNQLGLNVFFLLVNHLITFSINKSYEQSKTSQNIINLMKHIIYQQKKLNNQTKQQNDQSSKKDNYKYKYKNQTLSMIFFHIKLSFKVLQNSSKYLDKITKKQIKTFFLSKLKLLKDLSIQQMISLTQNKKVIKHNDMEWMMEKQISNIIEIYLHRNQINKNLSVIQKNKSIKTTFDKFLSSVKLSNISTTPKDKVQQQTFLCDMTLREFLNQKIIGKVRRKYRNLQS